ncbi:urea ABC transporter ATP-binding subunit UrtE [Candidatus Poribacteria bacterium]|nr:urea ABC transporter ATP-binding subunit UrtE [Candidatus Poribacteria bacterium]MEE2909917.1 urea ABC transporter ATP-binding subunit UrtE [Candidatus Poribacteria bacterium]|tara:strand:- start:48 stop:737 length:690 start_codon:yes stop_codon:yes gene_type:complete
MLLVENLSFSYGEVQALRNVSLKVPVATIVSVMGRNGVGKTTLMKNIVGTLKSNNGSVYLDNQPIHNLMAHQRVSAGIGYVPQGRMIFPKLTVSENLQIGLAGSQNKIIPNQIFDLFPILKDMESRMGGDLSGGQQQQLAIGRALVTDPKILILDEPTEGIQPNIIQQIGQVLLQLVQEKGLTVLIVEQYLDFVREFCQSFYIMNRGEMVVNGITEDLNQQIIREYLSV